MNAEGYAAYQKGAKNLDEATALNKVDYNEVSKLRADGKISEGTAGGKLNNTTVENQNTKGNAKHYDIVNYGDRTSGLENHHGVLDVWAKNNIDGYESRASKSTTMALTPEQHSATKGVYRD